MANKKKGKGKKNSNNKYANRKNNKPKKVSRESSVQSNDENFSAKQTSNDKVNDDLFGDSDRRLNMSYDDDDVRCSNIANDCVTNDSAIVSNNKLSPPKGLTNLGNTCYMNSVLQVISQTHLLWRMLNERSHDGVLWCAKGLENANAWNWQKPYDYELEVTLPNCLAQTNALINFMREMKMINSAKTVNPMVLLKEIRKKWSQFGGYAQQDAHELLRCLLDSVRIEEIKRQRKGIMNALNIPIGNTINLDDDTKAKAKSYALHSSATIIDSIFGGTILSSIICEECSNTIQMFEPFFDLSLSINEEKPIKLKKWQNRSEPIVIEETKNLIDEDSKTLTPKERKLRREQKKGAKRAAKQQKKNESLIMNKEVNDDEKSDDKTFDNDDENKVINDVHDTNGHVNNGENGNSEDHCNETNENENREIHTNECTLVVEDWSIDLTESEVQYSDKKSDDTPVVINDDDNDVISELRFLYDDDADETKEIDYSKANHSVKCKADDESEESDSDSKENINSIFNSNAQMEFPSNFESLSISDREKISLVSGDYSLSIRKKIIKSLKPHVTIDERDNNLTLENCMSQFTSPELLSGANKLCCENCTKINNGIKTYRNASKQMLIAIPPPVLTLHLKRFESEGYRRGNLRKINRFVSFPINLDLSPYTSTVYNYLTPITKMKKSNSLIYSLYGVVEHSGTLRGGHYTAYVKIRPEIDKSIVKKLIMMEPFVPKVDQILGVIENHNNDNDDTLLEQNGLSNGLSNGINGINETFRKDRNDVNSQIDTDDGKWYHISDTSVCASSLNSVLHAQAYILFYERIY